MTDFLYSANFRLLCQVNFRLKTSTGLVLGFLVWLPTRFLLVLAFGIPFVSSLCQYKLYDSSWLLKTSNSVSQHALL